ncbi:MAG: ATP-binding cassette domain-containing protein, partial [Desulfofustis sp.]
MEVETPADMTSETPILLRVNQLSGWIDEDVGDSGKNITTSALIKAVSFQIRSSQTVALVGESGSGKSITALSILRLLEEHTPIQTSGSILFDGEDLMRQPLERIRRIRGNRIAMIFQEPMTSLNPLYTIGNQIGESLGLHRTLTRKDITRETLRLLERTGIDQPGRRLNHYPHQLSGGQRQRVMIAIALACRHVLLIADEPTTALDVSIQAKILSLIEDIKGEYQMAMLLISHDLPLVKHFADYIYIMRDGAIIEHGVPQKILQAPEHGYTRQLIEAIPPRRTRKTASEKTILNIENLSCSF